MLYPAVIVGLACLVAREVVGISKRRQRGLAVGVGHRRHEVGEVVGVALGRAVCVSQAASVAHCIIRVCRGQRVVFVNLIETVHHVVGVGLRKLGDAIHFI